MTKTLLMTGLAVCLATPALSQATGTGMSSGTAQTGTSAAGGTTTATTASAGAPQVTEGATVSDASGTRVGTVSSVANGAATIDTGTAKAAVPVTSLGQGQSGGLVIGMTKAQLEQAVAAKAQSTQIAVGNTVSGPQGAAVGKVTAISGDLVTVQTAKSKVQLPSKAFAQQGPGSLVIGMTADQLDAAAKAAGAPAGG